MSISTTALPRGKQEVRQQEHMTCRRTLEWVRPGATGVHGSKSFGAAVSVSQNAAEIVFLLNLCSKKCSLRELNQIFSRLAARGTRLGCRMECGSWKFCLKRIRPRVKNFPQRRTEICGSGGMRSGVYIQLKFLRVGNSENYWILYKSICSTLQPRHRKYLTRILLVSKT